jgi:crossover junction endodeoxyribonuclease RusA
MVMNKIELHLPFPPRELSPNARVDWFTRSRAAKDYRLSISYLAVDVLNSTQKHWVPPAKAVISLTFQYHLRRKRDYDNCIASAIPLVNGLVDAGVLLADDSEHLEFGGISIESGHQKQNEGVRVRVEKG